MANSVLVTFDNSAGVYWAEYRNGFTSKITGLEFWGDESDTYIDILSSRGQPLRGGACVPAKALESACKQFLEKRGYTVTEDNGLHAAARDLLDLLMREDFWNEVARRAQRYSDRPLYPLVDRGEFAERLNTLFVALYPSDEDIFKDYPEVLEKLQSSQAQKGSNDSGEGE